MSTQLIRTGTCEQAAWSGDATPFASTTKHFGALRLANLPDDANLSFEPVVGQGDIVVPGTQLPQFDLDMRPVDDSFWALSERAESGWPCSVLPEWGAKFNIVRSDEKGQRTYASGVKVGMIKGSATTGQGAFTLGATCYSPLPPAESAWAAITHTTDAPDRTGFFRWTKTQDAEFTIGGLSYYGSGLDFEVNHNIVGVYAIGEYTGENERCPIALVELGYDLKLSVTTQKQIAQSVLKNYHADGGDALEVYLMLRNGAGATWEWTFSGGVNLSGDPKVDSARGIGAIKYEFQVPTNTAAITQEYTAP